MFILKIYSQNSRDNERGIFPQYDTLWLTLPLEYVVSHTEQTCIPNIIYPKLPADAAEIVSVCLKFQHDMVFI